LSKPWKFIVAVSLIAIITLFANEETVNACLCEIDYPPAKEIEHNDAVFRGEVISIGEPRARCHALGVFFGVYTVEFKVNTVWKGEINETTFVTTGWSSCHFGFDDIDVGEEYIVYASEIDWGLTVDGCSRTRPASNAQEDLEFLGEGWSPVPGSSDATPSPPEPLDGECPATMPDPDSDPPMREALPATGGCAPLANDARVSLDTTLLLLPIGVIWLRTRTRRRR